MGGHSPRCRADRCGNAGTVWRDVLRRLHLDARHGIRPADVCLSLYYNSEYTEHDIDVETAALVVALPAEPVVAAPGDTVVLRQLEAVSQMACTVHHDSLDYLLQAYAAIGQWIQANGYRMVGPCREIYLQGPHGDNPVTEIQ